MTERVGSLWTQEVLFKLATLRKVQAVTEQLALSATNGETQDPQRAYQDAYGLLDAAVCNLLNEIPPWVI